MLDELQALVEAQAEDMDFLRCSLPLLLIDSAKLFTQLSAFEKVYQEFPAPAGEDGQLTIGADVLPRIRTHCVAKPLAAALAAHGAEFHWAEAWQQQLTSSSATEQGMLLLLAAVAEQLESDAAVWAVFGKCYVKAMDEVTQKAPSLPHVTSTTHSFTRANTPP